MMRRLTFAVRDGAIELVSDQRVDMKVGPTPPVPAAREFWYEMRDNADDVLAAAAVADPLEGDREAFSPDPTRSVQRVPGASSPSAFSIVVPDLDGAESVSLMRAARTSVKGALEATETVLPVAIEVARFKLRKEQN